RPGISALRSKRAITAIDHTTVALALRDRAGAAECGAKSIAILRGRYSRVLALGETCCSMRCPAVRGCAGIGSDSSGSVGQGRIKLNDVRRAYHPSVGCPEFQIRNRCELQIKLVGVSGPSNRVKRVAVSGIDCQLTRQQLILCDWSANLQKRFI